MNPALYLAVVVLLSSLPGFAQQSPTSTACPATERAILALLVADDKKFQAFQVGLPRLRFGSRNPDVVIPAHCFPPGELTQKVYSIRDRV